MIDLGSLISGVIDFYVIVIVIYVLMSWFPISGIVEDVYNALATICEPWLGLFRRIVPPIGMIDISPFVAILVLNILGSLIARTL